MTDDFSAVSGEQGGYVPCEEEAAAVGASAQDSVAVYGEDGGFVAADMGASADESDAMDSAAIAGRGSGFVARPCDEVVVPGSITFLDTFGRSYVPTDYGWLGLTDSGHNWGTPVTGGFIDGYGGLVGTAPAGGSGAVAETADVTGFIASKFRVEIDFSFAVYDAPAFDGDIYFDPDITTGVEGFGINLVLLNLSDVIVASCGVFISDIYVMTAGGTSSGFVSAALGLGPGSSYTMVWTMDADTNTSTIALGAVTGSIAAAAVLGAKKLRVSKSGDGSIARITRIQSYDL